MAAFKARSLNPHDRFVGSWPRFDQIRIANIPNSFAAISSAGESRSEEHTSELQSLMRISYAVFCLKKKNKNTQQHHHNYPHKKNVNLKQYLKNNTTHDNK